MAADPAKLRASLLDEDGRTKLFPGQLTELLSRPDAKRIRIGFGDTVATISLTAKSEDRVAISVQHSKLAAATDIDRWKSFWDEFLTSIEASASRSQPHRR